MKGIKNTPLQILDNADSAQEILSQKLSEKEVERISESIYELKELCKLLIGKTHNSNLDKYIKLAGETPNDLLDDLPYIDQKEDESWHEALRTKLPEIKWGKPIGEFYDGH